MNCTTILQGDASKEVNKFIDYWHKTAELLPN